MSARKPNKDERRVLNKQGVDPKYFLTIKRAPDYYEFVEVTSGKVLTVRR